MKPVAGGGSEIIQPRCEVNILQPSYGPSDDFWRQPPGLAREEQVPGVLVTKRLDHEECNASRDICQFVGMGLPELSAEPGGSCGL